MELIQTGHHLVAGRYLAYSHPALLSQGKAMLAGFAPVDAGVRGAAKDWLKMVIRAPRRLTL